MYDIVVKSPDRGIMISMMFGSGPKTILLGNQKYQCFPFWTLPQFAALHNPRESFGWMPTQIAPSVQDHGSRRTIRAEPPTEQSQAMILVFQNALVGRKLSTLALTNREITGS